MWPQQIIMLKLFRLHYHSVSIDHQVLLAVIINFTFFFLATLGSTGSDSEEPSSVTTPTLAIVQEQQNGSSDILNSGVIVAIIVCLSFLVGIVLLAVIIVLARMIKARKPLQLQNKFGKLEALMK